VVIESSKGLPVLSSGLGLVLIRGCPPLPTAGRDHVLDAVQGWLVSGYAGRMAFSATSSIGSSPVTAAARLGFPSPLSFRVIDDLEPYFAGYRRFVLGFLRPLSPDAQGMQFLRTNGRFAAR
jgi:hypothetical protein